MAANPSPNVGKDSTGETPSQAAEMKGTSTGSITSEDAEDIGSPTERVATEQESPNEKQTTSPALRTVSTASTTVYPTGFKLVSIIVALQLAVFCMALDNTIIATAIPRITDDFHAIGDVGWYASAYLLTNASFGLLWGRIYTYLPLKPVFLAALALFEIGSIICAAAPNSTALIVGRAIAGTGAAGLFSGAVVILSVAAPLSKRPAYVGAISSMFGLASVVGPLMGGAFTDHVTWRLCFYINLPLGLITAIGIFFFFTSPPRHKDTASGWKKILWQFDPIGNLLFIPAIICLLLALQWGGTVYPWNSGRIIALFVVFGVLLLAFIADQIWMQENATVPPRVITTARDIPAGMFWGFCLGSGFFAFVFYLPIWFQAIQGDSATESGIHTLPFLLAQVFASVVGGIAITKIGYYIPTMVISVIMSSTGAGLITTFYPSIPVSRWIGYQIIYGLGTGFGFQTAIIIAQAALPRADIPTGSAVMMFCQILGGALFASVAQNTFQNALVANLPRAVPGIDIGAVLSAGATGFIRTIPQQFLPAALDAYNDALVKAFQVGLIMTTLAVVALAGQKPRNIKEKKKSEAANTAGEEKAEA